MQTIKLCNYKGLRDIGMRWVCRCVDCNELFLGIKGDVVCEQCEDKPKKNNGYEV